MGHATKAPSYRKRIIRKKEHGIVTLTDSATGQRKDFWLGEYGSDESQSEYHRIIAEWTESGKRLPGTEKQKISLNDLCLRYWEHNKDGLGHTNFYDIRCSIRLAREMYGSDLAEDFGPCALRVVRNKMVSEGFSRNHINKRARQIIAIFRWGASHELIPVATHQQLKTLEPLKRGKTTAKDPPPVLPVPLNHVHAIREHVSRQVWGLIQLQLYTGARGGELFGLRMIDIDTTGDVWTASLDSHKTAHHGKTRTLYFGKRAQDAIAPFMGDRPVDVPLFSPAEAKAQSQAARSAARRTPMSCGNRPGTNRKKSPRRTPRNQYDAGSYRTAIQRACKVADVPRWHPHQLRHTAATEIRREFGLEAAQLVLGHSSALITEAVYAERDERKILDVIGKMG